MRAPTSGVRACGLWWTSGGSSGRPARPVAAGGRRSWRGSRRPDRPRRCDRRSLRSGRGEMSSTSRWAVMSFAPRSERSVDHPHRQWRGGPRAPDGGGTSWSRLGYRGRKPPRRWAGRGRTTARGPFADRRSGLEGHVRAGRSRRKQIGGRRRTGGRSARSGSSTDPSTGPTARVLAGADEEPGHPGMEIDLDRAVPEGFATRRRRRPGRRLRQGRSREGSAERSH